MIARFFSCVIISIAIVAIGYLAAVFMLCDSTSFESLYACKVDKFHEFYATNIRGHIFAGFLALGGFLLSLKTFIVVNMKENVYDSEEYRQIWRKTVPGNKTKGSLYGPLKQLSDMLFYAILASITSAITQMTIGLYDRWYTAVFSIFTCVLATVLLLESLRLIKSNLDSWFGFLDTKIEKEEKEEKKSGN
ncbi:hypothetical protein [Agarivorans sp. JK6]|uniref:hypothetical protein n=1 Tax=Agarivorans sp. JK6 TaxID=2997426 RepID=UPI003872E4CF